MVMLFIVFRQFFKTGMGLYTKERQGLLIKEH